MNKDELFAEIGRRHLLNDIKKRYVCARCWRNLVLTDEQTPHARIVCPGNLTGECNGSGYVTKRYAARRLEESKFEYYEVKDNYPDLIPVKHPSPEIEALIFKELGF